MPPMADTAPSLEAAQAIPNRLFFRIGDVSQIAGIEAHVLRFWEGEFKELSPKKGSNGQRQYRRKDVETVLEIKRLLYDEGFTIPGARRALKQAKTQRKQKQAHRPRKKQSALFAEPPSRDSDKVERLKGELRSLLDFVRS